MLTKVFTSYGITGLKDPVGDPPTLNYSTVSILKAGLITKVSFHISSKSF